MSNKTFFEGLTLTDNIFIAFILFVFISGLFFAFRHDSKKAKSLAMLATSLGMLGTFVGIFLGLLDFNPESADTMITSITTLLQGMKTAFLTSILGMIASIIIKTVLGIQEAREVEDDDEDLESLIKSFKELNQGMKTLNDSLYTQKDQNDITISKLSEVFSEHQKDLKNELVSLNNSLNRKQDILIDEFRAFGRQMAQNNTDALVDALNALVKEFNENITEQFGENFKELNVAVGKLLVWQDNYKDIIESNTNQFKVSVDSISSIDDSFKEINDKAKCLIDTSISMDNLLAEIRKSQDEVREGLETLIDISKKANDSIPMINNYFENASNNVSNSCSTLNTSIENSIKSADNHVKELANTLYDSSEKSIETVTNICEKSVETLTDTLDENSNNVKVDLIKLMNEFERLVVSLNNSIPNVASEVNVTYDKFVHTLDTFSEKTNNALMLNTEQVKAQCDVLSKTNAELRDRLQLQLTQIYEDTYNQIGQIVQQMDTVFLERIDNVNKMLEYELKESLNSLGTQLATLSEKFVKDYTPLTERLREVVRISQGA